MKEKLIYISLLLMLYSGMSLAQTDAPYKGGAGDGYAMAELIIHEAPVGIAGGMAQELKVYPAPVKNGQDFFVHTGEAGSLNSIRFFDIKGNLLYEKAQTGYFQNQKEYKIPAGNLPAGIYFLQAGSRSDSITKKVIIL